MSRVIVLIDGEHYPPVVVAAIEALAAEHEVVAAVFLGGTEKVDLANGMATYGVPVMAGGSPAELLAAALQRHEPELVVDLSDEPVVSAADRFRMAGVALLHGASYLGSDFHFAPPTVAYVPNTPSVGVLGTGKRVGKTAVSADFARRMKAVGRDVVVLAMGRGGPEKPELIRGDEVALTTADLLALAKQGVHASSDNYEDAVMSRVTTVGTRRCGGGLSGEVFYGNVPEGARIADELGKELLVLEGSGAAIPPVWADANVLVVGAARGEGYVRDYFGPYRLALADLVIIAGAEDALVPAEEVERIRSAIAEIEPDLRVLTTTLRPAPVEPVAGKRVFFATTAPAELLPYLTEHLSAEFGCEVVGASANLSDRVRLREDMAACAGAYDVLLTELKAAAIDVVATLGEEIGVPTMLCDNVPVVVGEGDLETEFRLIAELATERGAARKEGE